jgi:hypothetical protein
MTITSKTSPHPAEALHRPAHPAEHPIRLHDQLRALADGGSRAPQCVPIANEERLVVPDALATTIKSTSSATRRRPLAWRRRTTVSGVGAVTHIGPTVVTCLEIRWPRASGLADRLPLVYSQPRAGRSATECERGRGLSALAGTPNADSARLTVRSLSTATAPRLSRWGLLVARSDQAGLVGDDDGLGARYRW